MANRLLFVVVAILVAGQLPSATAHEKDDVYSIIRTSEPNKRIRGVRAHPVGQREARSKTFLRLGEIAVQHHELFPPPHRNSEEDYQEIMAGGGIRATRILQGASGYQESRPAYKSQETIVAGWQKWILAISGTVFFSLLIYVYALKRELASLTKYIPMGYVLFPDHEESSGGERETTYGVQLG